MSTVDSEDWQNWVGNTQTNIDAICAAPAAALSATLDYPHTLVVPGQPLPVCWHWLYFQGPVAGSQLGIDGHPGRGEFLPPISLPHRMWAGSRVRIVAPLILGVTAQRQSSITAIEHKQGRSGDLLFVTVRHLVFQGENLVIDEEQDLVYHQRHIGQPSPPAHPAPATAQWSRELTPDPVLLFRYSAVTFNSHRIHYDREYAVGEEGYPALVVQGPLTATLLLDLVRRELPLEEVVKFEFRALRPLFEGSLVTLQGRQNQRTVTLWAMDSTGAMAMELHAQLAGH
ncbi:MAG: MaoC family dehydratase N-terminal domain-containing protein [Halioglobus sp.]